MCTVHNEQQFMVQLRWRLVFLICHSRTRTLYSFIKALPSLAEGSRLGILQSTDDLSHTATFSSLSGAFRRLQIWLDDRHCKKKMQYKTTTATAASRSVCYTLLVVVVNAAPMP